MPHKTINFSEFKAKCQQLMEEIKQPNGEIVITKNGAPLCKLVPIKRKPKTLSGAHRGSIIVKGNIVAPLNAGNQ